MTELPTFSDTSTSEIPTLHIPEAEYLPPKTTPLAIKRYNIAVLTFLAQLVSVFNRQKLTGLNKFS